MARPADPSDPELVRLVHSLELHQAELEAQNQELVAINSELKRANIDLGLARDRYRSLYYLAPVSLVTIDRDGVVHDANTSALALLRTVPDALFERRLAWFVAEDERTNLRSLIDELFSVGALGERSVTLVVADSTRIEVRFDGLVMRDDAPDRAVIVLVDATASRNAEQARRLRSLQTLAGGLAHDFNNLLTVIIASADHVRAELEPAAPGGEALEQILRAARGAAERSHQMLAYSGYTSVAMLPMDLAPLLDDLAPSLRAEVDPTPLVIDVADDLPSIRGDASQIRSLVSSLVVNAAEAMGARTGAVRLTVRFEPDGLACGPDGSPGPCLEIAVEDHGVGMDAATRAQIFEPYFSTKFVGRGLGLPVVEGIVRGHQGAIEIDSAPDRGTVVRVHLPAGSLTSEAAPKRSPLEGTRLTGTILVVDDEPEVRRALRRTFVHWGLEVVLAEDGQIAVNLMRQEPDRIDVVIMDLNMPNLDGIAASTAIREIREIPIILVTGFGDAPPHDPKMFAATFAKPFDMSALRRLLEQLLTPTA